MFSALVFGVLILGLTASISSLRRPWQIETISNIISFGERIDLVGRNGWVFGRVDFPAGSTGCLTEKELVQIEYNPVLEGFIGYWRCYIQDGDQIITGELMVAMYRPGSFCDEHMHGYEYGAGYVRSESPPEIGDITHNFCIP